MADEYAFHDDIDWRSLSEGESVIAGLLMDVRGLLVKLNQKLDAIPSLVSHGTELVVPLLNTIACRYTNPESTQGDHP